MPSRANLFVYSNAVTLLNSGLSNTGLENVIYCSTTTDAGPIQNFTATSLSADIPYYKKKKKKKRKKHLSSTNVLSNYLIALFISKLSIEKHQLMMKCGFREQGVCREKKFSHLLFTSYYVICLSLLINKMSFHIKIFKSIACQCKNDIFAWVLNYCIITLFS